MSSKDRIAKLRGLLSWQDELSPFSPLIASVGRTNAGQLSPDAAVCFDANVYLNLGKGSRSTELIDYFGGRHMGPLLVPHQVLLELWNNHLGSIEVFTSRLQKQVGELSKTIEEIDAGYSTLREGARALVDQFHKEHGHIFSETTRTDLLALLEMLNRKAIASQVDRSIFSDLAVSRKRTKMPPGFKDEGDGDFFVWVKLMNGLLLLSKLRYSLIGCFL